MLDYEYYLNRRHTTLQIFVQKRMLTTVQSIKDALLKKGLTFPGDKILQDCIDSLTKLEAINDVKDTKEKSKDTLDVVEEKISKAKNDRQTTK